MNNVYYQCDMCKYKNCRKQKLSVHMTVHMSREHLPKYFCKYCPKFFHRSQIRNLHERKKHTHVGEKFPCFCGKTFTTRSGLFFHRKNTHETGHFPCEICKLVFVSRSRLKNHKNKHEPKIACEICGKLFAKGPEMSKHRNSIHSERVTCSVAGCGKTFANRSTLCTHIATAHNILELECDLCGAKFTSQQRLKIHALRQHRRKDIKCPVKNCTYSSKRKAYLIMHCKNHKDISSGEKAKVISELKKKKFLMGLNLSN